MVREKDELGDAGPELKRERASEAHSLSAYYSLTGTSSLLPPNPPR